MQLKNWSVVIGLIVIQLPHWGFGSTLEIHGTPFSRSFFTKKSAFTVATVPQRVFSLSNESVSLSLIQGGRNIFLYETSRNGKNYEFHFKVDPTNGGIEKVGVLISGQRIYFSEKCDVKDTLERTSLQLQKIIDFIKGAGTYVPSVVDASCKQMLNKMDLQIFDLMVAKQFGSTDAYLLSCFGKRSAVDKMLKIKSISGSLPSILNNYFLDIKAVKEKEASFKVKCDESSDSRQENARYDEKAREITFPIKDMQLNINQCHSGMSVFSHEYLHHLGIKNEEQLQVMEAICAEANGLEGFSKDECSSQFKMKKCVENPESCNQMGVPEAIRQAVSEEAKKERAQIVPVLKEQVQDIKLENVVMESSGGTLPTKYDSSVQAMAIAMQRNMNKIAAVADAAIGASVNTAVAANTTTSARAPSVRLPASSSGRPRVEEYVAEEIIADKFGVPVSKVQEMAAKTTSGASPAAMNEIGSTSEGATEVGASSGGSTAQISDASAGGSAKGSQKTQARSLASLSTESALFNAPEIMGSRYQEIRQKLSDADFLKQIQKENIRIEIPREKRNVGSAQNNATVFVDTGRSFIRKKK